MGKRSAFVRHERDLYQTPAEAVAPLLPHLKPQTWFVEPCAGNGALIDHLCAAGHHCSAASDIEPLRSDVRTADFRTATLGSADCFITNPPWHRAILHPLIVALSDRGPTWLLFDADWIQTRQASPFLPRLRMIVAAGRVRWIPGSPFTGMESCAWHLFSRTSSEPARFIGRASHV